MAVVRRVVALATFIAVADAWDNGAALTPPMGFANWNVFGCDYDDAMFRSMADAFVSTGLRDAGYQYMLVQVRVCVSCDARHWWSEWEGKERGLGCSAA